MAFLLVATAYGLALRLPGLQESLWLDEVATWQQTQSLDVIRTIVATSHDTYPPLHNLLTLPFIAVFGEGEVAYRLPALTFGVLSIPAAYWLGRQAAGPRTALLAAVLTSLTPFAIYYAQEARMYALLMLTSTLFAAAVLAWLSQPSRRWALVMVGAGAAMLYTHPYGILALVSVGAGGLVALIAGHAGWRRIAMFVALGGLVMASYMPWSYLTFEVARNLIGRGFWIRRPNPSHVFEYLIQLGGGPLGLGLLLAGLTLALWFTRKPSIGAAARSRSTILVLMCLAFGPLLIGYVISQVTTPILVARYLICSLPALIVLAAIGYARLGSSTSRLVLQLALIVALMAPATVRVDYPRHSEDWRALASNLEASAAPGDCLMTAVPYIFTSMQYYGIERPECFFSSLADAAAHADSKRWLIAVVAHLPGGVDRVKSELPGIWSPPVQYGGDISLLIRQPDAP